MTVTEAGADIQAADGPGGGAGEPPIGDVTWTVRLRRAYHDRLWPAGLVLAALAAAATLTSAPGRYVGDNRYELFANPARRAAKGLALWDGSRGLGRVRDDLWPGEVLGVGVLRGLGLSTITAEHLFHALVLTICGVGTVALIRLFRPRIGVEHLLAGVLAMFGPFSAAFLIPSGLYLQVALAPWLVVCAYRGIHDDRRWRWAAAFALVVFLPGNHDLPGLVYSALSLVVLVVYVVVIDRSARVRDVVGWAVRAGALTVWVSTAMMVKTYFAAAALGQRLNDTESAESAALASSWSESFRGLGNWLSYFPQEDGLLKPQGTAYLGSTWIILATFGPPIAAVATVAWMRWRPRLLFGMMALVSLVVMVGAYPLDDQAPIGGFVLRLLRDVPNLAAFRNTYKGAAGLVIGVAVLAAVGTVHGLRRLRVRRPRLAVAGGVLTTAVVLVVAIPFWTGRIYDERQTSPEVPRYWSEAMAFLDGQADGSRVLVLPQGTRLGYRWGWVGDDIFDALLTRDHAVATAVPLSSPLGASMLEAVSQSAADPYYVTGSLAPLAQRLGIDAVVLRNDVHWLDLEQPRPAQYQGLRNDPDWVRVATFGEPGENTTVDTDITAASQYERTLPPVEVYALRGGATQLRFSNASSASLISGDGFAWTSMAALGLLDDGRPGLPSGALTDEQVVDELTAGAPVVVTDTNRRRLRVIIGYEPDYSHTLAEGEDLDRVPQDLFDTPGSQSVAWFPDAIRITASGNPRTINGSTPWSRPAMAFDGNPLTAWQIRQLEGAEGRRLRVELREAESLSTMRIAPTRAAGASAVQRARVLFSDGTSEDVDLSAGIATVTFEPREVTWFEIELTEVDPDAAVAGLIDVTVPGLDLREFIQAPEDLFRRGDADPTVAELLSDAPTSYLFRRSQVAGQPDEESTIRRRFRTAGTRDVIVRGAYKARATTTDAELARLLGGDVTASSLRRIDTDLSGWAGYTIDGDRSTGWQGPPVQGNAITVRTPQRPLSSVRIVSRAVPGYTPIEEVTVRVGEQAVVVPLELEPGCTLGSDDASCAYVGTAQLDATLTDQVLVVLSSVGGPDAALGGKVRIDEIELDGQPNAPIAGLDEPFERCVDLDVNIETSPGQVVELPVRLDGTPAQVLAGVSVPFEGCGPLVLQQGWHRLSLAENAPIDAIEVVTTNPAPSTEAVAGTDLQPTEADPGAYLVEPDVQGTGIVILNQAYDARWRAFAAGDPLGRSLPYDGLNGWRVDGEGPVEVQLRYPPQRTFRLAVGWTAIGVGVCLWLALRRGRPARG